MRRVVGLLIVVALVSGLLAVMASGCGKTTTEGQSIITPEGTVTVKKSGNSVTVTKGSKKTTWTAATASEKALDFPVPADATLVKGTAVEVSSSAESEKWSGATFYSQDATDAVINYYKAKLSGMSGYSDTSTTINNQMVGLFSVASGDSVKSVIIRSAAEGEQGKTWIQIATAQGAGV